MLNAPTCSLANFACLLCGAGQVAYIGLLLPLKDAKMLHRPEGTADATIRHTK